MKANAAASSNTLVNTKGQVKMQSFNTVEAFKSFMLHLPALCWIVDKRGNFLYLNTAYKKQFRFTQKAVGANIADLFPPAIAAQYLANNRKVFRTGKAVESMENGILPSGKKLRFKIIKFLIDNAGQQVLGGVAFDVTEELEKSDHYAHELQRFELINQATSEVTWDLDIASGFRNRGGSIERIFGYQKGPASGDIFQHVHPDDQKKTRRSFQLALRSDNAVWEELFRAKDASGNYRETLSKALIVRDDKGKAQRVVGTAKDISKEVMLKEKLVLVEKEMKRVLMENILKAQERERHEISTELHENLAQLLTTTNLLMDIAYKKCDKDLMAQSRTVLKMAVNELRCIQQRLNPANVSFIGLDNLLFSFIEKENKNSNGCRIELHDTVENEQLTADQQLSVFRIVQESIKNVLQHAKAKKAVVTLKQIDNYIHLTIVDDGIGCNSATLPWGLGLASIEARVEVMKGSLTINRKKGFQVQVVFN